MKDQIARVSMNCLLKDIAVTLYVVLNVFFPPSSHILRIPNEFIVFQAILFKENDSC